MPRSDWKTCRHCRRHSREVGVLSWRGLCIECSTERLTANNTQISEQRGPFYLHQQRRTLLKAQQRLLAAERAAQ